MSQTYESVCLLVDRIRYKGPDGSEFWHVGRSPFSLQYGRHVNGELQRGRKWLLSTHMMDEEVVQTALMAVLAFEEHEAREAFLFDGKRLFSPHKSLAALAAPGISVRPEA
jgi:hypothetical protein